jgi:ubiquinone/menaquinone biosynthesis C-methylase UbiE
MFAGTACYYDLIYWFKDYETEAGRLQELIHREHPAAETLLDVACGTGEHARFLSRAYRVDGVDIEPEFVRIAGAKIPSGSFRVADMSDFDLGARYDVLLCLFSSIGYLTEGRQVVAALKCFRRHLQPGGVIVVEPWFTPEQWVVGTLHVVTVDRPELKICRMSRSEREGDLSRVRFHYLIGGPGGVKHVTEDHELALYTREEMLGFFRQAGLAVRYDPEGIFGRGLYVARWAG